VVQMGVSEQNMINLRQVVERQVGGSGTGVE
jgi:hypothetical protein